MSRGLVGGSSAAVSSWFGEGGSLGSEFTLDLDHTAPSICRALCGHSHGLDAALINRCVRVSSAGQ